MEKKLAESLYLRSQIKTVQTVLKRERGCQDLVSGS